MEIVSELKTNVTILNFCFLLAVIAIVFYRLKKRRLANAAIILIAGVIALSATPFLPRFLVRQMESRFPPFDPSSLPAGKSSERWIVHVLGAGYTSDKRLPANSQLELTSLGRLTEGIRIVRQLPNSVLVTSGFTSSPTVESQASVARRAAISLGVEQAKIVMLETPRTTFEEASELRKKFGTDTNVIIVTDAIHMPRAFHFFELFGFKPTPAPVNFKLKDNPKRSLLGWLPSSKNIDLCNLLLHEYLGEWTISLTHGSLPIESKK